MHPLGVRSHSDTAQLGPCLLYRGEDCCVRGVREVGSGEAIPGVREQVRVLDQQLGRLSLGSEQSIAVGGQQWKRGGGLRLGCGWESAVAGLPMAGRRPDLAAARITSARTSSMSMPSKPASSRA